ncbi:glycosyltransferase [Neosynechococcus sphagnicola]|uniref:glycosyltransferase n=1 Tax=Neosynechococcus sphagnicola TaxID=1501145 RepID=UPI0023BAD452|nr:glycosyltransferase [Neosynechococcus sphagnicola]
MYQCDIANNQSVLVAEETRLDFSVVIPAYNEEDGITATLEQLQEHLQKQLGAQHKYEIIVVNDGSTDRTGESFAIADRCQGAGTS